MTRPPPLSIELHNRADDIAREPFPPYTRANFDVLVAAYNDLRERRGLPPTMKCDPTIQKASGAYFDFLNPDACLMTPEEIAHALSKICRCNGHILGDDDIYSVAQHCVVGSRRASPDVAFEFLMHDAAEFVMGDMTTPLKQLCADFQAIEKRVEHSLRKRYFLPLEMTAECKLVDIRMAATEKLYLMPEDAPGESWESIKDVEPYGFTIVPWPPAYAKQKWLQRFYELLPAHQAKHGVLV